MTVVVYSVIAVAKALLEDDRGADEEGA